MGFPQFLLKYRWCLNKAKGHCNLTNAQNTLSLSQQITLFSPLFLYTVQKEVWKDHLVSQRGSFLRYPRYNPFPLPDCSSRDHIKRFGKCSRFLYCCCCCVFPFPNNGLPGQSPLTGVQISLAGPPPPIPPLLSFSSHLVRARFPGQGPLCDPRQHAQGRGQPKHIQFTLWRLANGNPLLPQRWSMWHYRLIVKTFL